MEATRAERMKDEATGELASLPQHSRLANCRVCGSRTLDPVLDLGTQPLANAFLTPADLGRTEPAYPLVLCRCRACGHAQLSLTVSPDVLFREYPYMSGTSDTIPAHFAQYARDVTERFLPADRAFVVEVGSNDGTLLRAFDRVRARRLGIEPARNIAALARAAGIDTLGEFFGESLAAEVARTHGRADAIIANNVVAHIDDLAGLARGVATLLAERGVFVAEFPYLGDMLEQVEYDTIYHEHLSYFTVAAATRVFEGAGLTLFDVRRVAVHGGSLRIFVGRQRSASVEVERMLALERAAGYATAAPFARFAARVHAQRDALRALLDARLARGEVLAGYGAAAKGNTLLNFCGVDRRTLRYIADRSPLKQGLLTPGGHIPVRDVGAIQSERPDALLLLAWNFADEIMRQQAAYRERGGVFIVPIPLPREA